MLVRLRSSGLFDVYSQWFRPVGDFTFFWLEDTYTYKELKETGGLTYIILCKLMQGKENVFYQIFISVDRLLFL
ncbi:hypothetical protein MT390_16365 [Vibrio sp. 2-Bac 85]|uniref:hypothetical protein n=1 Tax=Psychromonas sp. SA13A TaxID=2686346 RepID=UPI00140D3EE5|nr:hypothetical protein [Psychromonas sp. SA13A]